MRSARETAKVSRITHAFFGSRMHSNELNNLYFRKKGVIGIVTNPDSAIDPNFPIFLLIKGK